MMFNRRPNQPGKYHQGEFKPRHPEKYVGPADQPIYFRSSWEKHLMEVFDNHPGIIGWGSEAIQIPYQKPFPGPNGKLQMGIYIPDFFIVYRDKAGKTLTELVEVKPLGETLLTEAKSVKQKVATQINKNKWKAAAEFCKKRGWRFRILNGKDIFSGLTGK